MAEHTIYTDPRNEYGMLRVHCACERFVGFYEDSLIGRALATSAKNAHRREVDPTGREILSDCQALPATMSVLERIAAERLRQVERWGEQRRADDTGGAGLRHAADLARATCQGAQKHVPGGAGWRLVLAEEVAEAFAETDPVKLVSELIQVAAVCAAWIEDVESR
jgi:hypothetical protein